MGFDLGYADGLRDAVRGVLAQAAGASGRDGGPRPAPRRAAAALATSGTPGRSTTASRTTTSFSTATATTASPRIPRLAGGDNTRTWFARSRSRVATGVLLTAPGVPMLFMGQEFLEDKLVVRRPATGPTG